MTYLDSLTPEERREMTAQAKDRLPLVYDLMKEQLADDLEPYLIEELKQPEYEGLTLQDLYKDDLSLHKMALLIRAFFESRTRRTNERMVEIATHMVLDPEDLKDLEPFLLKELKKPQYEGLKLKDLFKEYGATDDDLINNADARAVAIINAMSNRGAATDKEEGGKRKLRTIARAGDVARIKKGVLAIPTAHDYKNAISLFEQGRAYMTNIIADGLIFKNGKLYFDNEALQEVSEMQLQDLKTKENIESLNLPFLTFYYTQLCAQWINAIEERAKGNDVKINPITKFYLPDIAEQRGLPRNAGPESIEAIKKDIASFHNIVGVLHEGYKAPSYYAVLNFEWYDSKTNTIAISSPYLLKVITSIYSAVTRRDKSGNPKLKSDGTPQTKAWNSYLVHTDISKEKNKAAVQNVFILVQGIETRGGKEGYSLKAEKLIERNPQFKEQLERSSNKGQVLKRVFKKTWELLQTKTDLEKTYINIELPDPKNPANIPTAKTVKTFVIEIPHEGKKHRQGEL